MSSLNWLPWAIASGCVLWLTYWLPTFVFTVPGWAIGPYAITTTVIVGVFVLMTLVKAFPE